MGHHAGRRGPRLTRRHRSDLDESDIRVRPNPRGTRPRSKERPQHRDAVPAQVLTVDRGRYTCLLGGFGAGPGTGQDRGTGQDTEARDDAARTAGPRPEAGPGVVIAMTARELGRARVVVGDRVMLVGDTSGRPGSLARIVRVQPRTTLLLRSADDTDPVERPVVANADQLAIVTALTARMRPVAADTSTIVVTVTELYAATTFADLIADAAASNGYYCPAVGRYGDIDGDGAANSRDALTVMTPCYGIHIPERRCDDALGLSVRRGDMYRIEARGGQALPVWAPGDGVSVTTVLVFEYRPWRPILLPHPYRLVSAARRDPLAIRTPSDRINRSIFFN